MDHPQDVSDQTYLRLRRNYLTIYLLATFIDCLQGPYLYIIYSTFNYTKPEICSFYMIGFASSGIFGVFVGHFADRFGRKKLCLTYFLTSILACGCTTSKDREILMIGRLFNGISTSILCSAFESWYIAQHLSHPHLPKKLISSTFAKSTFYNGLTAITSGFLSSFLVDTLDYGPTIPFFISIPISILSAFFCSLLWTENIQVVGKSNPSIFRSLKVILSRKNSPLKLLGIVQIIFDTVMYVFVFLWTPVLEPIYPSFGFIFGLFMICMGFGSFLHSFLGIYFKISVENLLCFSVFLGLASIATCTIGVHMQETGTDIHFATYLCLIGFLVFEVAVGMYIPALCYLRGVVAPEKFRTSIVNWLRLPCNLLIVIVLLYIKVGETDNKLMFALSTVGLCIAVLYSLEFVKVYTNKFENIDKTSARILKV